MSNWDRFVETFFNAKVMAKYAPDIAYGTLVTIELAALVIVTGIAAGLALALVRSFGFRPLNLLIVFVVDLFRALPPLVIIVFIYFGLPAVELSPSGFVSTWLSLALVLMAFSEEIFWAGITSIHKGQWEARRRRRPLFLPTETTRGAPPATPPPPPAAPQPPHRHHERHGARPRGGGERDPRHGFLRRVQQLHPVAAHARRDRVPDPVPA